MPTENKIKILIVDDEELLRDRLKRLLELDDYEVTTADSGARALVEFARICPDIVLSDVRMPGMDGIELLEKLKQLPHSAEIFMLTGHGGLETAIAAMRNGAFDYMTKPIDFDELEINLKRALEKRTMTRKLDAYMLDLEAAQRQLKDEGARLDSLLAHPVVQANPVLTQEIGKIKDGLARLAAASRPV